MKACEGELTLEKHRWQHVLISKQVNPEPQLKGIDWQEPLQLLGPKLKYTNRIMNK